MWTDQGLSQFLLVKVKVRNKMLITIPIAFSVIDDLLDVLEDWMWLCGKLFPRWSFRRMTSLLGDRTPWALEAIGTAYKLPGELLYELRKHGRWKLVHVDTKDAYVSVEFY